jgi:hypothetical protein
MKIKISEAPELISIVLMAKLVPMVHGSPAVGKSAIVRQIAKKYGLYLIDMRLSQCDPTDLLGFPRINNDRAGYVPMETFPIEGDTIPEGYNGWLLFLDEFNSAPTSVQAAAYKIVLDRMVGQYNLHKNVAIVCAGNLETDNAIVQPMSTAMKSRLIHLEVEVNLKQWLDWADEEGIDHRIISYLEFRPDQIYTFNPDHSDHTYASPRTWEFASKLLKITDLNFNSLPIFAGTISEGVAREFWGFTQIEEQLPKLTTLVNSPETAIVPDAPSAHFALCGVIAANINKSNCEPLMEYIGRLPAEFQMTAVRRSIKRSPEIKANPKVGAWISRFATELV